MFFFGDFQNIVEQTDGFRIIVFVVVRDGELRENGDCGFEFETGENFFVVVFLDGGEAFLVIALRLQTV